MAETTERQVGGGEAGGLQDLWTVVKTLAFALNEMGGMESSEQIRDVI